MKTLVAGIEMPSDGSWDCGSTGGEWSGGGCGCTSGEPCSCGCKGAGSCGGSPSGSGAAASVLRDCDGEIWALSPRSNGQNKIGLVSPADDQRLFEGKESSWAPPTVVDSLVASGERPSSLPVPTQEVAYSELLEFSYPSVWNREDWMNSLLDYMQWWISPWCPDWLWEIALACAAGIEAGTSAGLQAGAYGAGFSHCLSHCLITATCPCGLMASYVIGLGTELYQTAAVPFRPDAAQSAMQQSDFWDNQLGRSIGSPFGYNPLKCFADCKAKMGGVTNHPEGPAPGSNRPNGPFHPTAPGPMPTFGDVIGATMPPGWGP